MSDSDKVVAKMGQMSIKAPTTAGAAYVAKVTHPPSAKTIDFKGVPDSSAPTVTHLELKAENNFPPILTLPTGKTTTETTNPSSMLFLQTSGNSTAVYCFLGDGQSWVQPFSQDATPERPAVDQKCLPASRFNGYNFAKWTTDCSMTRTTYKSTTHYLNATNFNNQGTVTTAKFKPNLTGRISLPTYIGTLSDHELKVFHKVLPLSWRNKLMEHIAHKASTLNRYSGTEPEVLRAAINDIGGPYNIQVFNALSAAGNITQLPFSEMFLLTNVLPQSAGAMLQTSPKATSWEARDGSFTVLQPIQSIQQWTTNEDTTTSIAPIPNVNEGLVASFIRCGQGNTFSIAPLMSYPASPTLAYSPSSSSLECVWNNLDWSMTLFEGLTVPSTTGTTLSSVPYITTKSFVGIECQPQLNSSWLPFLEMLPLPDPEAITMANGIFHARLDALPAAANDLGSIASTVLKFIPNAVTWLKDLFGNSKQKEKAMSKAKEFVAPSKPKAKLAIKPAPKPKPKPKPQRPAQNNNYMRPMRSPMPYNNQPYTNGPSRSRSTTRPRNNNPQQTYRSISRRRK